MPLQHEREMFDFGRGPVPAHTHIRGGGWVADTASVHETAYVGRNARVFDAASVCERARICGSSRIMDFAFIGPNSYTDDNVVVSGTSVVGEHCSIDGDTVLHDVIIESGRAIFYTEEILPRPQPKRRKLLDLQYKVHERNEA